MCDASITIIKCKMTSPVRSAQILIILLVGIVLASTAEDKVYNTISTRIKYATLDITVINNLIHVRIERIDGVKTHNILHTFIPDVLEPFVLDRNCGLDNICVKSSNATHTVIHATRNSDTIHVYRISSNPEAEFIDCYELSDGTEWFGGPQFRYQHWPVQHMYYEEEPYLPTNPVNMALAERYWLSSKGNYLYVNETDPLFLDQNNYKDKNLCLISKNKAPYRHREVVTLSYEIGVFSNVRQAHEYVVRNHLGKPSCYPNERMIKHPIWSTWARYKMNVSEDVVVTLANEIIQHGFNNSQLEIDDNWETCYGSAVFDPVKFPNITRLTHNLKKKGFRITLWIHPFINKGCEPAYSTALNNSYFVKNLDGQAHMKWWQGNDAATIDFTNPEAVRWWVGRLKRLQQSGIDSFKFDAGEVSWLPQVARLNSSLHMQPGIFTYDYVNNLAKNFDDSIEVRVGWRSQNLPIFVRMIDKDTRWTWNNGLPTLITTLLLMNLNGYVHVLPDMIGGNGYFNNQLNGTVYPEKELFIRWLQANVFMPSLQYSFTPWDFDNETIAICKKYTDLHAEIAPKIINSMQRAVETGTPVNPPIWWIDPSNTEAHKVNDEYLLGTDILVAPVTEKGAIVRDIYLPAGRWKEGNGKFVFQGRVWLFNYPAPLNTLPFFIKVE